MNCKQLIFAITLCAASVALLPDAVAKRNTFFVDGYHGGIYGHYPVEWKTQFIVDQLKRHPRWCIGLEIEPETWDTVRARTPEAYAAFAAMVTGPRMEYTNPTYAQPYCYNIQGESLLRQFAYGIRKLRSHFPSITFSTYSAEEPCFTSALPAILKGFGFKYISLKCPDTCWGGYMAPFGGQLVTLVGPDGTEIPAVPRYGCEELQQGTVWQTTAWNNSPEYLRACREAGIDNPVGMCYQDAGWRNGPWLGKNRTGSEYVLWTDYIDRHTSVNSASRHTFSQDDVRVNLMWGSQVMQRIGRSVRRAENDMLAAEKMGALVWAFAPTAVPDFIGMDEAWRQLMLAQHHDSWIVPYNGLWHFGTWADAIDLWTTNASRTARAEMQRLAHAVAPGERTMIKVFNTAPVTRTQVVAMELPPSLANSELRITDADGREVKHYEIIELKDFNKTKDNKCDYLGNKVNKIIFEATVPPAGYATYGIARTASACKRVAASVSSGDAAAMLPTLENGYVKLTLNLTRGGTVEHLILKNNTAAEGTDYAPGASSPYALGELRGFFYDEGAYRSSTETPARIVSRTETPMQQSITIAGEIANHPFTQTYTLRKGSPRVDCTLRIEWQGNPGIGEYREEHWNNDRRAFCDDRYKLCVLFPTSFAHERVWKDAPFDVCESHQSSTQFNRWSGIKHNVILNWIDVANVDTSQGLGIITDHTTSYVHDPDYPTALTVQYSGQGLWGRNYLIDRPTELSFAIVPHADGAGAEVMTAQADDFNEPLLPFLCGGNGIPERRSFLSAELPGYRISSAMATPDGSLELRLHNTHASPTAVQSLGFTLPGLTAVETDLLGQPLPGASATSGSPVSVAMPVNGFKTWRIVRK